MQRLLLLLVLIGTGQAIYAQYVYTIKADSVKITNSCDTAELIIENHTQNVPGFLYNKGKGRTEFRRGAAAIDDSLYLIGGDTINLYKGRVKITASNGLTATNGNVKLGGLLTDNLTELRFQGGPAKYSRQFAVRARDYNAELLFGEYNPGGGNPSSIDFHFHSQDPLDPNNHYGGFSTGTHGFSAYSANGGPKKEMSIDNNGFHVVNSNSTFGFSLSAPYDPYIYGKGMLQIAPGNSSPGGAPIKLSVGTLLTTMENNAIEYDGDNLYLTEHSVRYKLAKILDGQLTTNFGGAALSAFNAVTTTLSIEGALPGDVVNVSANTGAVNPPSIIVTAYVTSANTVTLRAYNASNSAVTIASDTYKVRVIK